MEHTMRIGTLILVLSLISTTAMARPPRDKFEHDRTVDILALAGVGMIGVGAYWYIDNDGENAQRNGGALAGLGMGMALLALILHMDVDHNPYGPPDRLPDGKPKPKSTFQLTPTGISLTF